MLRLLITLKYLKFLQIWYLLSFKLFKYISILTIKKKFLKYSIKKNNKFYIFKYTNIFDQKIVESIKKNLKYKINWNLTKNKLYLYNLHYLNYIFLFSKKDSLKVINSWIDCNKISHSSYAWDIYPSSLRLINLIKWSYKNCHYSSKLTDTIYVHAIYIIKNFEYHLGGNHLLINFKSVIFAFSYFKKTFNKKKMEEIEKNFIKELKLQILKDGGHFENSPMYHNQIIFDLLDIVQLNILSNKNNIFLINIINKMMNWSKIINHNGEIPYFNDSCSNLQPNYFELLQYFKIIKIKKDKRFDLEKKLNHFNHSGFVVFKNNNYKIIFRSGGITSNSIPAHHHANTLSFEVSTNKGKIFTNSGISTYENNSTRHYERGTMSQNTISLNRQNSSDVWKSFRVGKRPRVKSKIISENNHKTIFNAEHNGFTNGRNNKILHKRKITCNSKHIKIDDLIYGNEKGKIYFNLYLDNNITVKKLKKKIILSGKFINSKIILTSSKFVLKVSDSTLANNFFLKKKSKKIYFKENFNSDFSNSIDINFK